MPSATEEFKINFEKMTEDNKLKQASPTALAFLAGLATILDRVKVVRDQTAIPAEVVDKTSKTE